ncbi:MAG: ferredoxin family 2Fe-2S iron-sulfur cluster binding protein [Rhodothalassiaceae bacterium]
MVRLTFIAPDGRERRTVEAPEGITLLKLAHREGIDVEGACGGAMACSTCHMIFRESDFERLPPVSEEEDALLDLAPGATATSRLGCQIRVSAALEGIEIYLPAERSDIR